MLLCEQEQCACNETIGWSIERHVAKLHVCKVNKAFECVEVVWWLTCTPSQTCIWAVAKVQIMGVHYTNGDFVVQGKCALSVLGGEAVPCILWRFLLGADWWDFNHKLRYCEHAFFREMFPWSALCGSQNCKPSSSGMIVVAVLEVGMTR